MQGPSFSRYNVLCAFQHLMNGRSVTEGAVEYDKYSSTGQVRNWIDDLISDDSIKSRTERLKGQAYRISANIINAKLHNNQYECVVRFGDNPFLIQQIAGSRIITITDCLTHEATELENVDFPDLQKQVLVLYIEEQRELNLNHIELREMDLEDIDLNGIDFTNVALDENQANLVARFNADLSEAIILPATHFDTLLTRQQLDEHIKNNHDLSRKQLKPGESTAGLWLNDLIFDKTMAQSLIDAGMDAGYVLQCYLQTPPTRSSDLYKAQMLQDFLEQQRATLNKDDYIDLSEFDLSDVASKYYCEKTKTYRQMNFSGAMLTQLNFRALIKVGGNLRGVKLAAGVEAAMLGRMDGVKLDKDIAIQLIEAGANPRTILLLYLASKRELHAKEIDLSGMDLHQVARTGIDLRNVNTNGITFAPPMDVNSSEFQAQFEADLLAVLSTFAQVVNVVIKQSSSRDAAKLNRDLLEDLVPKSQEFARQSASAHLPYLNTIPDEQEDKHIQENFFRHHFVVRYLRDQTKSVTKLKETIRVATGNCGEKSKICKDLLDLYLQETLTLLGYDHFPFHLFRISAEDPNDHNAVELVCFFNKQELRYIVDPWGLGYASKYDEGIRQLNSMPDSLTNSDIKFKRLDSHVNTEEQRQMKNAIFIRSGVKDQLTLALRTRFQEGVGD